MTDAVVFDRVTKRYRQYRDEAALVTRLLRPHRSRAFHEIRALDDISFHVGQGETLGIIGRNGSGKTTLLRLLSGVSAPTSGRIRVQGPIAPLIGIGVGFNAELTGRENVRVNGRLLGMSPDEIERRFDDIVAFSEVEDYLDIPVKFYSSGMFLRLAFAVAVHTRPAVMAVDEILAVGDVGFQAKSFDRMRELQQTGTTIVVVTHNLQVLQRIAPRTVLLDRGQLVHDGPTEDAIKLYYDVMQRDQEVRGGTSTYVPDELGGRIHRSRARVEIRLVGPDGQPTLQHRANDRIRIEVTATFDGEVAGPIVGVAFERVGLGMLFAAANDPRGYDGVHGPDRPLHATVDLDEVPLLTGGYLVRAVVQEPGYEAPIGSSVPVIFHVTSERSGAGTVDLRPRMTLEGREVPLARPRLG